MNIYVGNLSFDTTEDQLRQAFGAHGAVTSASIIKDKYSGESRGFGFVEMASRDEATAAINALNVRPCAVNCTRAVCATGDTGPS